MTEVCGKRLCGENPGGWQWRNGFGINEREQQYVHMKSQPKKLEICKWQCGSESEINGQRRLPSSKKF